MVIRLDGHDPWCYIFTIVIQRHGEAFMSRVIHARLDAGTERMLRQLERQFGWNDSQVVREGIKALTSVMVNGRRRRIIGLGRFRSGIPDLGSNKAHLRGFGR
jgi:hypothetical protein